MEGKMFVGVSVEVKDGRFFFDIMADKGLYMEDIRSILVGAMICTLWSNLNKKFFFTSNLPPAPFLFCVLLYL